MSGTCESAISTAMPLVKPMTMLTGTKRTRLPRRKAPIATSRTPAIKGGEKQVRYAVALDDGGEEARLGGSTTAANLARAETEHLVYSQSVVRYCTSPMPPGVSELPSGS